MAPVLVDPSRIRSFADASAFAEWLAANHAREPEIWIRIAKKGSGIASVTTDEAIDICLCWGWIDAIRKGLDEDSFLQRYTPRGPKSLWSKVNVEKVARLSREGRMTEVGLRHVEAAKADGRWDRAYRIRGASVPLDLMAAIEADPEAHATFATLTAQNRFALIHRTDATRTDAGRAKTVARFVAMLARGETIHPQKTGRSSLPARKATE